MKSQFDKLLSVVSLLCLFTFFCGCASGNRPASPLPIPSDPPMVMLPGNQIAASPNPDVVTFSPETVVTKPDHSDFSILFINVHKADAALITAGKRHYLVDTGEKESLPILLGILQLYGIQTIDGVFLSHTHSDHTGALKNLAKQIPIGTLYRGEFTEQNKKGDFKLDQLAEDCKLPIQILTAGTQLELASGYTAEILGPDRPANDDDNDQSLVLLVHAGNKKILFTGDMQFEQEDYLLSTGTNLKADVLKVGNHGNPDATSEAFANAVSPEVSIISTDTSVDPDSANPRVQDVLSMSHIYSTERSHLGLLLTISPDGSLQINDLWPQDNSPVISIMDANIATQSITLQNHGNEVDISNYMIYSTQGGELFVFPSGSVFPAHSTITVACKKQNVPSDFLWDENKVWSSKKEDIAILFNAYGQPVDKIPAE